MGNFSLDTFDELFKGYLRFKNYLRLKAEQFLIILKILIEV